MQHRTKQVLQTLRRAHAFLVGREYRAALSDLTSYVEALATLVERLEQHAGEQDGRARSARAATDTKRELARALRQEYLRPIAHVARHLFDHDANLRNTFALPRTRDGEGLLQAANAIAERAGEHRAQFIASGLAPDFVERLRDAIAALRTTIVARGLDLGRRSAATAGLLQDLARGRRMIRLLDLMIAPRLANQRDELAEWRSVTRFVRRRSAEGAAVEQPPVAGVSQALAGTTVMSLRPTTASTEVKAA